MLKMVDLQQDDLERALEKEMDNMQSTEAAEMHDLLSNFSGFLSIRRVVLQPPLVCFLAWSKEICCAGHGKGLREGNGQHAVHRGC